MGMAHGLSLRLSTAEMLGTMHREQLAYDMRSIGTAEDGKG